MQISYNKDNYIGNELTLFQNARNWKHYFGSKLAPYIKGEVLEVGAGLGGTSKFLFNDSITSWTYLEPDKNLIDNIPVEQVQSFNQECINGCLDDILPEKQFDCIIYIDVLEHLEQDQLELTNAAKHLKNGGVIVSLSPAHQSLYNEFDQALGHYRRYNKEMFRKLTVDALILKQLYYLDPIGLLASLTNKLVLKQNLPTKTQINFWDKWIIPVSKIADKITNYSRGKSIVAIWQKPTTGITNLEA